jgi:hypothetical protein
MRFSSLCNSDGGRLRVAFEKNFDPNLSPIELVFVAGSVVASDDMGSGEAEDEGKSVEGMSLRSRVSGDNGELGDVGIRIPGERGENKVDVGDKTVMSSFLSCERDDCDERRC